MNFHWEVDMMLQEMCGDGIDAFANMAFYFTSNNYVDVCNGVGICGSYVFVHIPLSLKIWKLLLMLDAGAHIGYMKIFIKFGIID